MTFDQMDALDSWKREVARLQSELRKAQEATAAERARADKAEAELKGLRGVVARAVREAMLAIKPGDCQ